MSEQLQQQDARLAALGSLFDNAGMFPPTAQPLEDALASHRAHQSGERRWLIRRFIVRASDAVGLGQALEPGDQVEIGVVLDAPERGDYTAGVASDLSGIAAIARDSRVQLTKVAVRMPCEDPAAEIVTLLAGMQGARLPDDMRVALEVPLAGESPGRVLDALEAIAEARATGGKAESNLVAKMRVGGAQAVDIPADVEVAGFLRACAGHDIPITCVTAAAFPHRTANPMTEGTEHGFLNLIAATAAARRGATLDQIEGEVARPKDEVVLSPEGLTVGGNLITEPELAEVRSDGMLGLGCSDVFDPITWLAALGAVLPTGGLAPAGDEG